MLAVAVIVFREVLEAALIVSIVMAASVGVAGRTHWVAGGTGAGFLGACLVAMFAASIADAFQGSGQEILNAGILLLAVCMLGWHNLWMARHARHVAIAAENWIEDERLSELHELFANGRCRRHRRDSVRRGECA